MTSPMDERELRSLRRFRSALEALSTEPGPAATLVTPPSLGTAALRSVAVLPGAFNPPTVAHVALAEAAAPAFDAVLFSLGRVTIDKEESGLLLEDRLWLLERLARRDARFGVIVPNRGLYSGIAEATRRALPTIDVLAFLVGMDKVPQLFDPRYYDDPERELEALFSRARFLVAPRGADDRATLERLLAAPMARPYAARFEWLELASRWRDVSATKARSAPATAEDAARLLPDEVREFLRRTGAFSDPRRYAERGATLAGLG
jgi:nicotinic acid mononucleotide adenylyltransferase